MGEEGEAVKKGQKMTPEQRERIREVAKGRWADPDKRNVLVASMNTKTAHKRRKKASKARWADPEYHQNQSKAIKDGWTPEVRKGMSETQQSRLAELTPEDRKRMVEPALAALSRPGVRRRLAKRAWTPERRQDFAEQVKKMWAGRQRILAKAKAKGITAELKKRGRKREDQERQAARQIVAERPQISWGQLRQLMNLKFHQNKSSGAYRYLVEND